MKKFRKIMAVLVAAIMVVAMTVPAWAADQAKSGKINLAVQDTGEQKASISTPKTIDVTIPAKSKSVYVKLPETKPSEITYTGAVEGYEFLGWTKTAGSTELIDRLLVTETDLDDNASNTDVTVYAVFGPKKDLGGDNHDFDVTTGTITINNSTPGETYTVYQLFKLYSWKDDDKRNDQHADDTEAYSYYIIQTYDYGEALDGHTNTPNPIYNVLKGYHVDTNYAFKFFDNASYEGSPVNTNRQIVKEVNGVPCLLTPVEATDWFRKNGNDENTETEYVPTSSSSVLQTFTNTILGDIATILRGAQKTAFENCTLPVDSNTQKTASTSTTSFTSLPLGYYLVDSSLGSLCALDTTTTSVNVIEKNYFTSFTKAVDEDSTTPSYGDKNDADFGQEVKFQSVVNIPRNQSNVVYHDIINTTKAFTLKSIDGIKIDGTAVDVSNYHIYETSAAATFKFVENGNAGNTAPKSSEAFPIDTLDYDNDNNTTEIHPIYASDTFAIAFEPSFTEGFTATNTAITIDYTAVLNDTAIIGDQKTVSQGDGNDNQAWTTYGGGQTTEVDWTRTYTWRFDIFKYTDIQGTAAKADKGTGTGQYADYKEAAKAGYIKNPDYSYTVGVDSAEKENKDYWIKVTPLAGAKFKVKKGTDTLKFTKVTGTTINTENPGVAIYKYDATSENEILETPTNGLIYIIGLDADTYTVTEDTAPRGYDLLHKDITVEIDSDTDDAQGNDNSKMKTITMKLFSNWDGTAITKTNDQDKVDQIEIVNFTGKEMPMTGGMGTTVLYIVGGMLVILAGAYLFFSRKRTS